MTNEKLNAPKSNLNLPDKTYVGNIFEEYRSEYPFLIAEPELKRKGKRSVRSVKI